MFVTMIAMLAMTADVRATARPARTAAAHAQRHRRTHAADLRAARLMHRASTRMALTPSGAPRAGYRLAGSTELAPGVKEEAVADTGQRCAIIGQTLCSHKRRTVFHTAM